MHYLQGRGEEWDYKAFEYLPRLCEKKMTVNWSKAKLNVRTLPNQWVHVMSTTSEHTAQTYMSEINRGFKLGDNVVARIQRSGDVKEIWAKFIDEQRGDEVLW